MNGPWSYSGFPPTVGFQEMKEQITWLSLETNTRNPCLPPLSRKPKPCSEIARNFNRKEPLETTTPLLTQPTVWQDMNRPLYSGCEQDELASWTLHSATANKRNRRSTTSSGTVPSGENRDTSYGRRMSQPPTSCGEGGRPALHHPIPGNMWTEGLSTADRPQKKKNVGVVHPGHCRM